MAWDSNLDFATRSLAVGTFHGAVHRINLEYPPQFLSNTALREISGLQYLVSMGRMDSKVGVL
jgi:hypothetical protein